jgi:hypothetical protein
LSGATSDSASINETLKDVNMYTNQKQLRELFWATFPNLPRRRHRYSWNQSDKTAELVYHMDTRVTWCDWIDELERDGSISPALANRATL